MYNVQYTIYFTVSGLRLPQPGGPGPCIYIPQEPGSSVIPPGTGCSPSSGLLLQPSTNRVEITSLKGFASLVYACVMSETCLVPW
jgi:hypothetical protein